MHRFYLTAKLNKAEGIKTLLHELAHAYHAEVIPDGFSNQCILDAYEQNVDLYYNPETFIGYTETPGAAFAYDTGPSKPYLTSNAKEYFAELTVLYFLDFELYPYHRVEFFRYDPGSYKVIEKSWKDPAFCQN